MSNFANCSGFSDSQLTILTALRGGTSAVASITTTVLLIVACTCQSKLGVAGRQDRYLKVGLFALFGVSISYLIMLSLALVYHLLPDPSAGRWCAAFGFFVQILSVIQITLLFTSTYPIVEFLWSEITRACQHRVCCKKNCVVRGLMGTVIVLAALILLYSFVPFITKTYGEVCVWCWIFTVNKNCKVHVAGFLEQIFLWNIYKIFISLMCLIMMLASLILFFKACAYMRRYHNLDDGHDYKHLLFKYIFQLIILIPVFVDFSYVVFNHQTHHYSFILWVYFAIAPPVTALLIPLSFLLYMKFGNAGSKNDPQPAPVKSCSTTDDQCSSFTNVIAFASSDVYVTAMENRTHVDVTTEHSTEQAEGQYLLEGRWNMQYST